MNSMKDRSQTMKRQGTIILIGFTLLLLQNCSPSGGADNEVTRIPVEIQEVQLGQVKQSLNYNGDIKAEFEVNVFSKIPDRIEKYYVDDGDAISRGDPIAHIVATAIEETVNQAKAALTAAKAQKANMESEFVRAQKLYREDAMSKQQYDGIQTQYEAVSAQVIQAEAGLAAAKSQLRDATVTSPISGIVGKRYYEEGDMAAPSMPVARIVQMNNVEIKVEVTESDLAYLDVGQNAEIQVRTYPDEIFVGKTTKISPILDPVTRMATVEILIPNTDHRLKPGMYAEVEITTGVIENTIVVPRHSVIESTSLERQGGQDRVVRNYYVYVIDDSSRADQRLLEVQHVNHQNIAVRSGIYVGEKLVISGQNNLRDGLPVLATENEEMK